MTFQADPRTDEEILAGMKRLSFTAFSHEQVTGEGDDPEDFRMQERRAGWVGALLEDSPQDPSASLLKALAGSLETVLDRFNTLSGWKRERYLTERLGLQRRQARADHVYAKLEGIQARLPITVPGETDFLSEEDKDGVRRTFTLPQSQPITGSRVGALVSYQRLPDGSDLFRTRTLDEGPWNEAVFPFGRVEDMAEFGLERTLYLSGTALAAARHETWLRVRFEDVRPTSDEFDQALRTLEWSVTTLEGYRQITPTRIVQDGASVSVIFHIEVDVEAKPEDELAPLDLDERVELGYEPALRLKRRARELREGTRGRSAFLGFRTVELSFEGTQVPVSAALVNAHPVDVESPFAPMGDPGLVGSTLHLAAGAVFSLPLTRLVLDMPAADGTWRVLRTSALSGSRSDGLPPRIGWSRWRGGAWRPVVSVKRVRPLPTPRSGEGLSKALGGRVDFGFHETGQPFSARTRVGGQDGSWLQARLMRGDFGWSRFLAEQEEFLREASQPVRWSLWGAIRSLLPLPEKEEEAPVPPTRPESVLVTLPRITYASEPVGPDIGDRLVTLWTSTNRSRLVPRDADQGRHDTGEDGVERFYPFTYAASRWPGELLIGLEDLVADSPMNLYFDVRLIRPKALKSTDKIEFSYWSPEYEKWRPLEVLDGTLGLTQDGILHWHCPEDWLPVTKRELFNTDVETPLSWLRVAVEEPTEALCVQRLVTDVVDLPAILEGPEDPRPDTPLPAGTKLTPSRAHSGLVAAVTLEESRDGRGPEPISEHVQRASRTLTHRGRALTPQDTERLLMDHFPGLAQVRTLRARSETERGLEVVALPIVRERFPVLSAELQRAIQETLQDRVPPGCTTTIRNPEYQEVSIEVGAEVNPLVDAEDARADLERFLSEFLQPWNGRGPGQSRFDRSLGFSEIERALLARCLPGTNAPYVTRVHHLRFARPRRAKAVLHPAPGVLFTSAAHHAVEVIQ